MLKVVKCISSTVEPMLPEGMTNRYNITPNIIHQTSRSGVEKRAMIKIKLYDREMQAAGFAAMAPSKLDHTLQQAKIDNRGLYDVVSLIFPEHEQIHSDPILQALGTHYYSIDF